jgi:hypothetical protein
MKKKFKNATEKFKQTTLKRKTPHPPPQREKERGFLLFSLPSPLWQLPERLSPAQI